MNHLALIFVFLFLPDLPIVDVHIYLRPSMVNLKFSALSACWCWFTLARQAGCTIIDVPTSQANPCSS